LFFDASVCRQGQGVGIVLISPRGTVFEQSARLKYLCTNNQAEYEAIPLGMHILSSMGIKHVEAFGDSLLVMQQVTDMFQCFDGSLNASKLLLSSMILLCSMFPGMKIQWQTIWRSKPQVFDRIEENLVFWKNRMFRFLADAHCDNLFCLTKFNKTG
jgi:ribonuclease HI